MDIKVKDLKQTETIKNSDKFMVLVDDKLNLVKNITKEEFLTNVISTTANNALIQEADGNLYVNTSEIADSLTALDDKFTSEIGDLNNLTTEAKNNLVSAINEAAQSGGSSSGTSLPLFTPVIQDHVLSFEETMGFALQGTYVYKTGIAGERYGYPDFIKRCIDEMAAGTASQVTLGDSTITMYTNANGHQYYNIADKEVVDAWFNTWGIADFYGIDAENERVFLPRNNRFIELTTDSSRVNFYNRPGLPNINFSGEFGSLPLSPGARSGVFSKTTWGSAPTGSAGGGENRWSTITFDASASDSNPIYGNSDTVQVASTNKLLYYVVGNTSEVTHVTTTIPDSEIISQVNKNTSDIVDLKDNGGMPDLDNGINMGLPQYPTSTTLNTKFTPPVNGYIKIIVNRSSAGNTLIGNIITPDKNTIKLFDAPAYNATFFNCFIPISKGNQFYIITDSTSNTWKIIEQKFYPMKGVN